MSENKESDNGSKARCTLVVFSFFSFDRLEQAEKQDDPNAVPLSDFETSLLLQQKGRERKKKETVF
jgi:hypothetical protein